MPYPAFDAKQDHDLLGRWTACFLQLPGAAVIEPYGGCFHIGSMRKYIVWLLTFLMLTSVGAQLVSAQQHSRKKEYIIGGGAAGALIGGLAGGGKGALIGAGAGAGGGYLVHRYVHKRYHHRYYRHGYYQHGYHTYQHPRNHPVTR
jgi:hypothetical protein